MYVPPPGSAGYYLLCALAWIVGASAAAFVAFWVDRRRHDRGLMGVPESTLLWIAALGGWPGAKLAQWCLQHKQEKRPFSGFLNTIVYAQVLLVALSLLPQGTLTSAVEIAASVVVGDVRASDDSGAPRRFGPFN